MKAVEWLAAAATDPRACKRQWDQDPGTALLEAGRFWDVLSVPEDLGLCTLNVITRLPPREPGPTLVDRAARRVGFFLPPGPDRVWAGSGMRHAGYGSWVAVPPPHHSAGRLEWLVPPDGTGTLHDPRWLELALHETASTLAALTPVSNP
jgi:hypothetical protein